jgi:hypothetical protein
LSGLRAASTKQKERMKRFPVDSVQLVKLREQIDSVAFERAKNENTEAAYLFFLASFPHAIQQSRALELRDEAAYLDALKQNTYRSFNAFILKYPDALRSLDAKSRYDKLLFIEKTKDKKLRSYENFLHEYPTSPYRVEAEKNIFEITTATGTGKSFEMFLKKYPESSFVRRAMDIWFHIAIENNDELPDALCSDSLLAVMNAHQTSIIPFFKDGHFGFMDTQGHTVINAVSHALNPTYRCGHLTEDVIVLPDKLVAKNGKILYHGQVISANDLGYGFLQIQIEKGIIILHKSGFSPFDFSMQGVKLLNGSFLATNHNGRWGLSTLTGRNLTGYEWDDISALGEVIVFKKQQKHKLETAVQLGLLADQNTLKTQDFFDSVKSFSPDLIWARTGDYEGVLDKQMNYKVPFDKHRLEPSFSGIVSATSRGKKIYSLNGNVLGNFEDIKDNELWTAVKQNGSWRLLDSKTLLYQTATFDSIGFIGPFAIGYNSDSVRLYFSKDHHLLFLSPRLEFIPGKDSTSFILVEAGGKRMLYDGIGEKLFQFIHDAIQYAGNGIFIVNKKEKKGLVDLNGIILLPAEFDAISSINNNLISVLKNMKFGLYNTVSKKLIKTQFDKNIIPYNEKILVGFKDGFYGFISWDSKPIGAFEFDEVVFWNDTTALVKKDAAWMFYEITGKKSMTKINSFRLLSDINAEKIVKINLDNKFGVLSSTKGIIVPINFTKVINLGSADEPFYFTETHVNESFIIVTYFNKTGEMVRREVYEEEAFELIDCPDN